MLACVALTVITIGACTLWTGAVLGIGVALTTFAIADYLERKQK